MASYSISYDHNSVTFTVTGCSSLSETHLWFYIRLGDVADSEIFSPSPVYAITGDTITRTFSLDPETHYACTVFPCYYENGQISGATSNLGGTFFTTPARPVVADWDWTVSNGSATADQTYIAYRGITECEYWLGHFHYKVWNDLANKTNEVIADRGGTWNTTYGTLAETLLTVSDTEITSSKLNAVWWNLSQYVTTGLSKMAAGDDLPGSYFVTLAEAINNAIWRG